MALLKTVRISSKPLKTDTLLEWGDSFCRATVPYLRGASFSSIAAFAALSLVAVSSYPIVGSLKCWFWTLSYAVAVCLKCQFVYPNGRYFYGASPL